MELPRRTADQLLAVLDRLIPLASAVATGIRILAWTTFAVGALFLLTLLVFGDPAMWTWAGVAIYVLSIVVAGGAMLLFHGALVEVLALPDALRQLPEVAATHSEELTELVREARAREKPRRFGFLGDTFRAGRLLLRAHKALPGYGSALRLVSWPFLVVAGVAVVLSPFLIAFTLALTLAVIVF